MKTSSKRPRPSAAKTPRGRKGGKNAAADMNQATTDDFEREDLGIAAKE